MAKLTIVIVNYNVKYYITQCLDSIYKSTLRDINVVVVDNHSHDGSVEYIRRQYPSVRLIALNHNLGFARANNVVLRSVNSPYVLLLNPDTVLGDEVLEQSVDFMDAHPSCGGLGLRMLNADGSKAMESRRGLPTPMTSCYKMIGLCRKFPENRILGRYYLGYLPWDRPSKIEVISGAYCMLRKKALDKIGVLDEDFFMYGEDIDISYRLLKGGFENWYLPVSILHYKGESTQKSSFRYVHVFYEAMLIFFRKHYGHLSLLFSLPIKFAIYVKAALAFAAMLLDAIQRKMGFVDRHHLSNPHYIFIGNSRSLDACRKLSETKGLSSTFYEASPALMPNGHLDLENIDIANGNINYIVYDLSSYSYNDVLRIFALSPRTNVKMAFYHPEHNMIITNQEVLS